MASSVAGVHTRTGIFGALIQVVVLLSSESSGCTIDRDRKSVCGTSLEEQAAGVLHVLLSLLSRAVCAGLYSRKESR